MKTKNVFLLIVTVSVFLVACTPFAGGDDFDAKDFDVNDVYYVLNSGDAKSNNSSLTKYDAATGLVEQGLFEKQNGRVLGNTANDIVVYGSKMYIAVTGESTIEVVDLCVRSIKQVRCEAQPRYMAVDGGKVYISYYNGHVARLDTATLNVEAKVKVGRNPEQLAVVGNRLYVANSGGLDWNTPVGYDKTVSVIDLLSFEEIKKIDVVLNPNLVIAADKGVFVISVGNYADVPAALQYINAADDAVSEITEFAGVTEACYNKGVIYGFSWNPSYISYDIVSRDVDSHWIKEQELPRSPYKLCSAGEYVCVTESDYINDGDVSIYDTDGMLVKKIAVGLNPIKMVKAK